MDASHLPVSKAWFETICEMGSKDALRGQVQEASAAIAHPFWCRQLFALVPGNMFRHFIHNDTKWGLNVYVFIRNKCSESISEYILFSYRTKCTRLYWC